MRRRIYKKKRNFFIRIAELRAAMTLRANRCRERLGFPES
jgi:hypothetical protein